METPARQLAAGSSSQRRRPSIDHPKRSWKPWRASLLPSPGYTRSTVRNDVEHCLHHGGHPHNQQVVLVNRVDSNDARMVLPQMWDQEAGHAAELHELFGAIPCAEMCNYHKAVVYVDGRIRSSKMNGWSKHSLPARLLSVSIGR